MKKISSMMWGLLAWTAIFSYIVVTSRYCSEQKEKTLCRRIEVVVQDSARMSFITPAMVRAWFAREKKEIFQQEISKVNTLEIDTFIRRRGFVRDVRVYTSLDGVLHIELTQRCPIARVSSANGYNFYITDDGYILPTQRHEVVYVPVITGMIHPPFARDYAGSLPLPVQGGEKKVSKNYVFFSNLINFVKFVREDDFWNAFIVQIDLQGGDEAGSGDPQVRIVPRVGDQVVLLGSLDNYPEKLDRLMRFYRNGMPYESWDRYRYIDVRYQGQVVCTR